jgi:branched-chain amino acid transport system ATP-binding protein
MLSLESVRVRYGAVVGLEDGTLKLGERELVCLIGANGAGKSTLLNAISAVVPLAGGKITFEGEELNRLRPEQVVRRRIIHAPEGRQIFAQMLVEENLQLGAYVRRHEALSEDFDRVYATFPRLAERRTQYAGSLSGGEQQMLAIGRALMARPRVLLLDEPSMGLAPIIVEDIFATLRQLRDQGISILLVEQNARAALRFSDRAYVLTNGRVEMEGKAADIARHEYVREAFLGKHSKGPTAPQVRLGQDVDRAGPTPLADKGR